MRIAGVFLEDRFNLMIGISSVHTIIMLAEGRWRKNDFAPRPNIKTILYDVFHHKI